MSVFWVHVLTLKNTTDNNLIYNNFGFTGKVKGSPVFQKLQLKCQLPVRSYLPIFKDNTNIKTKTWLVNIHDDII